MDNGMMSTRTTPKSDADFQSLMAAVDAKLASRGVPIPHRPFHAVLVICDWLKMSVVFSPDKALAAAPGYSGSVLIAKANAWFELHYGERLKVETLLGAAPVRLGNALWRVKLPVVFGTAAVDILGHVEGLTPSFASRIPPDELRSFAALFERWLYDVEWATRLPENKLICIAEQDYRESTSTLLGGSFLQSAWASQQAVEKLIKGLLGHRNHSYEKGHKGHELVLLGKRLSDVAGVKLEESSLTDANWHQKVRYGEVECDEAQALKANHAYLDVLHTLRENKSVDSYLAGR